LKEKSFKIEDEYETIFGISLFSKTLSCKEIEHFVEIKTNLKIDLLLQWAKLFLNFNK